MPTSRKTTAAKSSKAPTKAPARASATTPRRAPAKKGTKAEAPWRQENPRAANGQAPHALSAKEKAAAKRSAREHDRPYPNLVDNLRVINKRKEK